LYYVIQPVLIHSNWNYESYRQLVGLLRWMISP
jgi:hypothetical protein